MHHPGLSWCRDHDQHDVDDDGDDDDGHMDVDNDMMLMSIEDLVAAMNIMWCLSYQLLPGTSLETCGSCTTSSLY